jgi:plasmid segregation protein ParM
MPNANEAIAVDLGHSAVKSAYINKDGVKTRSMFRSVVLPAFSISDEAEARRAMAETVMVGGRKYFYGETAEIQGGAAVATGLSEDWVETPEYTALLLGAIQKIQGSGGLDQAKMIVMGLPTHVYTRYKDRLKDLAMQCVEGKEIKVVPQPLGAYQRVMLDEMGNPAVGRSLMSESHGVAEVGYFSTDFMLMQNGRWVEKASGTCSGVRVAAEHLMRLLADKKGITADLGECERALQTRKIKSFGQQMDVSAEVHQALSILVAEVVDTATRLMEPYARKLDGIVVAGGGAPFVFPQLKEKWPHSVMPEDHRFAVAEGMRRFGLALLRARELTTAAAAA